MKITKKMFLEKLREFKRIKTFSEQIDFLKEHKDYFQVHLVQNEYFIVWNDDFYFDFTEDEMEEVYCTHFVEDAKYFGWANGLDLKYE